MDATNQQLAQVLGKAEACKINVRSCSCLAQVLSAVGTQLNQHSKRDDVEKQIGFFKLIHDVRKWMELNSKPGSTRIPRKALKNIWTKVNDTLYEVAQTLLSTVSTAAPSTIETYWENDIIEQMLMTDLLCIVLWIQQDYDNPVQDDKADDFMTRFDTDNVAVFRIPVSSMKVKFDFLESKLQISKFDGRIRIVVNATDPVAAVKVVNSYSYLRSLPVMVNMSNSDNPEDSIFTLGRLKSDIHFSVKPSDFDKFCAFATALWINYKEDPSRTVVEKKINKTGVVIQKTDSMEKGLRYMDTHRHLGYLDNFRIIIGDGLLNLDESTESSMNAAKKKEFFSQRAAQMRAKAMGGRMKSKKEEEFSTLEIVQVLRNRLKWQAPLLIFQYTPQPNIDLELYKFNSIKTTDDLNVLEYFATMRALPWAMELSAFRSEVNTSNPGILRIVNIRCNELVGKKIGSCDTYVTVKIGDQAERKTKKSSNSAWNLGWEVSCKLTDRITFNVKEKSLFAKNDFEASFEGSIVDLIPVATPLVEATKILYKLSSKSSSPPVPNSSSNSSSSTVSSGSIFMGTITVEVGFRFEGHSEKTLGLYFGRSLSSSLDISIRDATPHLVEKCVYHLMSHGAADTEGIFRQPASERRVEALKENFDKGIDVDLSNEDVQDVAFLLRNYLRELPDPLIPTTMYEDFKAADNFEKRRDKLVALATLLTQLPTYNLESFANIMQLLSEISKNESVNKMPARNLASVLGPAMVIPKVVADDAASFLSATTAVASVLECCIHYCNKIFTTFDTLDEEGGTTKKKKTLVQTFIDPYLTDSMSSPRLKTNKRGHDTPSVSKPRHEFLQMNFVLKEEIPIATELEQVDPYEDTPEFGDCNESQPVEQKAQPAESHQEESLPLEAQPNDSQDEMKTAKHTFDSVDRSSSPHDPIENGDANSIH